jgi:hypothetical protein
MRLAARPVTASAEPWDPADPGPFRALAGSQFLRADGDRAVVRTQSGREMSIDPGWLVILPDGGGDGDAAFAEPRNVGGPLSTWEAA